MKRKLIKFQIFLIDLSLTLGLSSKIANPNEHESCLTGVQKLVSPFGCTFSHLCLHFSLPESILNNQCRKVIRTRLTVQQLKKVEVDSFLQCYDFLYIKDILMMMWPILKQALKHFRSLAGNVVHLLTSPCRQGENTYSLPCA